MTQKLAECFTGPRHFASRGCTEVSKAQLALGAQDTKTNNFKTICCVVSEGKGAVLVVKTLKEVMSTVSLRMCARGKYEQRHGIKTEHGALGEPCRGPGTEGEGRANVILEEVQGAQVIGSWEVILESVP